MQFAADRSSDFHVPRLAKEIVSAMQEPFALLDGGLRLVGASQAFFFRFGLEEETSLGKSLYALGGGQWDSAGVRELLEELAPRNEVIEDYRLDVGSDGSGPARVAVTVRPIRGGMNVIEGYLCAFKDPEPELAPEEVELARRIRFRGGDLAMVLQPQSLRVLHSEGGAPELTGYRPAQLEGMPLSSLLHPEDREPVSGSLMRLQDGGAHRRLTFRLRHRGDHYVWVEALCAATIEGEGPPLIHLAARDITERKRAEDALRWLGRQTKLILDTAGDGIFGVDRTGTITFINPAAARALGYRVPELLGRSYRLIVAGPGDEPGERRPDVVDKVLDDGLSRVLTEAHLVCVEGTELLVELTCNASSDHGVVTGAVVTFRPIAERKRSEAAALRARWLAGVGETTLALRHEINNPLTTLLAEARLLEMGGNSDDEERQMVAAICTEARRIASVIRRLSERQDAPKVRLEGRQRMLDLR